MQTSLAREDRDNIYEEERKAELAGSITKIIARKIRTKERIGREAKTGRRTKTRHDDDGNNTHIG